MNRVRTLATYFLLAVCLGCTTAGWRKEMTEDVQRGQKPLRESVFLWGVYPEHKISPPNPAQLKHAGLMELLGQLAGDHPDMIRLRPLGESVQGRSINLLTVGSGPKKLLLWSQMHGDEPTATAAPQNATCLGKGASGT